MSKFTYFLEVVWMVIGLFSVAAASRELYLNGYQKSIPLYLIALVSFAVYFLRRYTRKSKGK
ncbi:MAG: hypothetical protein CVU05_04725 [Bacteroidetes bacterium HGW-Bacteroidetes-21]|jgi:hypothetical protein|nr:MAG: hypothetical protein CVU05_04725 [Bacteroidetes bacterium HGW-Bacteroidetes-21]